LAVGLGAALLQGQVQPLGLVVSAGPASLPRATLRLVFIVGAALVTSAFALTQGYSPFLYFRF
jgi:hypothetical protein